MRKTTTILRTRPADDFHQVVTVQGGKGVYRKKPCAQCPWRKDATCVFPAEAFRHSAETAYDMATHTFGCHQSGAGKPQACAGFLLRGSDHNLTARIRRMDGTYRDDVSDGGHPFTHDDR